MLRFIHIFILLCLSFAEMQAQINCPSSLPMNLVGNTSYCIGTPGASLSISQNYSSYEWIPTGQSTQNVLLTAGSYSVVVTHYTGCTDTLAFQVQQVSNPPQPTIESSGPLEFCEGESVTLNVSGWYPYYDWNTGSISEHITVYQSGTFLVSITDWIGCVSSSNAVQVTVHPLPVAAFSPNLNEFDAQFNNHSQNATAYEWNFGDGTTSTDFEPVHSYASSGTLSMWLVAFNACGSDTSFLNLESVGIEEEEQLSKILIYPNPSNGQFQISIPSTKTADAEISLIDMLGREVYRDIRSLQAGQNRLDMRLSQVPSGIYAFSIRMDGVFYEGRVSITP